MRNSIPCLASALVVALALAGGAGGQPPRNRGGPPDRFGRRVGPGEGLERALDGLNLPEAKKETAVAAVRAYQADVRRLTDLAGAGLLMKMKEVLSQEE